MAIQSFRDKPASVVFEGRCPKGFPSDPFKTARRRLVYLDAAERLDVLSQPLGNRLEPLIADRQGQHSIRINDQFRICFRWTENGPEDVEIVDYHGQRRNETVRRALDDDPEIVATLPPLHPGEILREEFIRQLGLTAGCVARACGIARSRIERIAAEQAGISGDTALRLGEVFSTGPELWMNLQARYEIETAKAAMGDALAALRPIATSGMAR